MQNLLKLASKAIILLAILLSTNMAMATSVMITSPNGTVNGYHNISATVSFI